MPNCAETGVFLEFGYGRFKNITEGANLLSEMAERLGVDLKHAFDNSSDVGALALREVVVRCAACQQHEACQALQAEHSTLLEPPEYCRNSVLFKQLNKQ